VKLEVPLHCVVSGVTPKVGNKNRAIERRDREICYRNHSLRKIMVGVRKPVDLSKICTARTLAIAQQHRDVMRLGAWKESRRGGQLPNFKTLGGGIGGEKVNRCP